MSLVALHVSTIPLVAISFCFHLRYGQSSCSHEHFLVTAKTQTNESSREIKF